MNYNDFPILNNDEYKLLNEHYLSQPKPERKYFIFKTCKELNNLFFSCFNLENSFNHHIKSSIIDVKDCLKKLLDNLTELFNISLEPTVNLKNFNLFSFIKTLSRTTSLFLQWSTIEEKDYYKSIAQKSSLELLTHIEQIMHSLEISNVKLFKHM